MHTLVEGKKIAEELIVKMAEFVKDNDIVPSLVALVSRPDIPTQQFLRIKGRVAKKIGIAMNVIHLPEPVSTEGALIALRKAQEASDGIVIQLPLPREIDIEVLLSNLVRTHDPDCIGLVSRNPFSGAEKEVLPPVVSAIREMCKHYGVALQGARTVVVGQGRLVGAPASVWFETQGALVTRLTRESGSLRDALREADIVVLGAGVPGLVTPDMLKEGVVIFDAGTSEEGGRVVGDADPSCIEKARLMTPVPGGIGPVAVAELFANLLRLQFDYGVQ